MSTTCRVGNYELDLEAYYDRDTHLWVRPSGRASLRCGLDPLGAETYGDIVALAFEPVGTAIDRGQAFGSLEAAKYVGPLLAPVSGILSAPNQDVLADPGLLARAPLDHWLVEIEPRAGGDELAALVHGVDPLRAWFEAEIRRFQREGALAE